jgi:hypothetical protein
MELALSYIQRINLHALFGAQRGPTLDDTRAFWRLQDLVGLSDDEKREIDYRIVPLPGGAAGPEWNMEKCARAAPLVFTLTSEELARIERAVKEWQPGFFASIDRAWLEPLLEQFEEIRNNNGLEPAGPALRRAR